MKFTPSSGSYELRPYSSGDEKAQGKRAATAWGTVVNWSHRTYNRSKDRAASSTMPSTIMFTGPSKLFPTNELSLHT